MADDKIRSLLLIDAEAAERRLVSATASRSGWTVINAPSVDGAIEVLRGPHGREVHDKTHFLPLFLFVVTHLLSTA